MLKVTSASGFGSGPVGGRADMSEAPQSGLLIHSRADTDVSTATGVDDWGNSAGANWLQGTTSRQPAYDATATAGSLDGAGVITFDGSSDGMQSLANNGSNTQCHWFLVIKQISWTNYDAFLESTGGSASQVKQYSSTPNIAVAGDAATVAGTSFTIGTWYLLDVVWDGGTSNWHVNKNNGTPTTGSGGNSGWSTHVTLGATNGSASAWANFDIAEILAYSSEQTSTPLANIQNYINDQYGLW